MIRVDVWMLVVLLLSEYVQTGTCDSCHPGYYRHKYYDRCHQCPENCATCTWLTSSSCGTCNVGYYGYACRSKCSQSCESKHCRKSNGWCTCIAGYYSYPHYQSGLHYTCAGCSEKCITCTSSKCTRCNAGYFGRLCSKLCHYCRNNTCSIDGRCTDGCVEGFYPNTFGCEACPDNCAACRSLTDCTSCNTGYYGTMCEKQCAETCSNCHQSYGHCTHNCTDGLYFGITETKCIPCPHHCSVCAGHDTCLECTPGNFGQLCELHCSKTCLNGCNKTDGHCYSCADAYFKEDKHCEKCSNGCARCVNLDTCYECNDGYFQVPGTSRCEACDKNCVVCTLKGSCKACDSGHANVEGNCVSCQNCLNSTSCASLNFCHQCIDGAWGPYCGNTCNATCVRCDQVSGQCLGCKVNTFGRQCELNCSRNCIQVSDSDSTCWQHNGSCTDGCIHGFSGPNCTDESSPANSSRVALIVGPTSGAVVLLVVVVIVLIVLWRRNIRQPDSKVKRQEPVESRGHQADNAVLNPVYNDTSNDNDPHTVSGHQNTHSAVAGGSADDVYAVVQKRSPQKPLRLNKMHGHDVKNFETENVYDVTSGGHGPIMQEDSKKSQAEEDTYSHISHASRARQLRHDDEGAYDHVTRQDLQKGDDHDETYDVASGHNSLLRKTLHYSNDEYSTVRRVNMEQPDFPKRKQYNVK